MTMSFVSSEIRAKKYVNHMKDLLNVLRSEMLAAQAKYGDDVDVYWLSAFTLKIKNKYD